MRLNLTQSLLFSKLKARLQSDIALHNKVFFVILLDNFNFVGFCVNHCFCLSQAMVKTFFSHEES